VGTISCCSCSWGGGGVVGVTGVLDPCTDVAADVLTSFLTVVALVDRLPPLATLGKLELPASPATPMSGSAAPARLEPHWLQNIASPGSELPQTVQTCALRSSLGAASREPAAARVRGDPRLSASVGPEAREPAEPGRDPVAGLLGRPWWPWW